jgi:hypothetical protein
MKLSIILAVLFAVVAIASAWPGMRSNGEGKANGNWKAISGDKKKQMKQKMKQMMEKMRAKYPEYAACIAACKGEAADEMKPCFKKCANDHPSPPWMSKMAKWGNKMGGLLSLLPGAGQE